MIQPFTVLTSKAVVLDRANIDTDQIIPARFLKKSRAEGYQNWLFYDLRHDSGGLPLADFPLNRPDVQRAAILVSGANFGCGSSREGAVYALVDAGIRAVIAPSFGDIFHGNALKNGLLPVRLPEQELAALLRGCRDGSTAELTIDLTRQEVALESQHWSFEVDPFRRECLLMGIDEIDLTLQYNDRIADFQETYWSSRPWLRP
jgi:3-isopropylmalate/(R)-2-methylmalate dehydratase small subunit